MQLFTLGCTKSDDAQLGTPPYHQFAYYGSASALRNDKPWNVLVYSNYDTSSSPGLKDRFNVQCERWEPYGGTDSVLREALVLTNLRYTTYTAKLENPIFGDNRPYNWLNVNEWAVYDQFFEDGDVAALPTTLDTTKNNFIEITSYNAGTREVSGRFSATFLSYSRKDTIRFTDGTFYTKIY